MKGAPKYHISTILPPSDERFVSNLLSHADRNSIKEFIDVLSYAFSDVAPQAIEDIAHHLIDGAINREWDDETVFLELFRWYTNKDALVLRGFDHSYADYMNYRAQNIATIIRHSAAPDEARGEMLDIGSGNCALSSFVANNLNMNLTAIDLEEGSAEMWGSTAENDFSSRITRVFYDGENLEEALPERQFDLISYNNSLHHFPSFAAQKNNVKQAINLLKPGGVIFFAEHHNVMNDPALNLSHLLLSFRHQIDRNKNPAATSNSFLKYAKDVCGEPNYLSPTLLTKLCLDLGLEAKIMQPNTPENVSRSFSYSFVKPMTQTREITPSKTIDDGCDSLFIRKASGVKMTEVKHRAPCP